MTFFIWLIYAFWLILIGYLIVSAIGVKPDSQGHLLQSFGLLLAIIVSFLLPHLPMFNFLNFAPVNPVVSSIGVILCGAGMAFLVWARQHLGKNWSQTVSVKVGHDLVTSGPYRYVRHPMYTGGLVTAIGSAIVCGGVGFFFSSSSVSFFSGAWARKIDSWHNCSRTNSLTTRNGQRR